VRVQPLRDPPRWRRFFDVQACNDTNFVDLFVFANDSQLLLMARLDNLGKGASGAAVQSMNVHLGVDEGWACSGLRRPASRVGRPVVVVVAVDEAQPR
jgi:N-acetyl-gamma-glutamyl-phosphate reductase